MSFEAFAASAVFGLFGGVLAGLFGIGGGAVLVPFLYALLDTPTWTGVLVAEGQVAVVAHATSLAVIVPTSLVALWSYQRSGGVPWGIVARMGGAAIVGAVGASQLAPHLSETVLRGGFTVFLAAVGFRLLFEPRGVATGESKNERASAMILLTGGVLAGLLSSLLGVGGGMLAIPFLIYAVRIDVAQLAAASMGVVALAAGAGTVGYALAHPAPALPSGTIGYIFLPAALALMPGAVLGARAGVRLNRRLPAARLRVLFAVLLLILSARLGWSVLNGG